MGAYTSTASGNFNSTAIWTGGVVPSSAGDTWTISAGTTVIYNVNSTIQLLVIDNSTHSHTIQEPDITITYICIPHNSEHKVNSEHLTLGTNFHILTVSDSTHGIQSDVIGLASQQILAINNSSHVLTSNTVGSLLEGSINGDIQYRVCLSWT